MAVSPSAIPERVMPCRATASGSASAPSRGERPSGRRFSAAARTSVYCAKAPSGASTIVPARFSHWDGLPSRHRRHRPHLGVVPQTIWSPSAQPVTPSPRATMVPEYSCPATRPGLSPQPSSSMWMSDPQMPQWSTSTSTWPGPGRGTGRSSTVTTPGRW